MSRGLISIHTSAGRKSGDVERSGLALRIIPDHVSAQLPGRNFVDADHFPLHESQFRLRRVDPDVQVDLPSLEAARLTLPRHGAIGGSAQDEYCYVPHPVGPATTFSLSSPNRA